MMRSDFKPVWHKMLLIDKLKKMSGAQKILFYAVLLSFFVVIFLKAVYWPRPARYDKSPPKAHLQRKGQNSGFKENSLFGYSAGYQAQLIGSENSLFGSYAGAQSQIKAKALALFGSWAGYQARIENYANTVLGSWAGYQMKAIGSSNSLLGSYSGWETEINGSENSLIGSWSGYQARLNGENNTLAGSWSGYQAEINGKNNMLLGAWSGYQIKTDGSNNVFLGPFAGHQANIKTDRNINIGNLVLMRIRANPVLDSSVFPSVSNKAYPIPENYVRINGVLQICGAKGLNCQTAQTKLSSSRVYKKNIQPFKNFKQALKEVLETPLFTYEYKTSRPAKKRMGIVAEKLPKSLQIKKEGLPPEPDWPSVYGRLWAGIKALHKISKDFKTEVSLKLKALSLGLEELRIHSANLKAQVKHLKTNALSRLFEAEKIAHQNRQALAEANMEIKRQNKALRQTQKKLNDIKNQLKEMDCAKPAFALK